MAAPTPTPMEEGGRLLQRLVASESRRLKSESRLRQIGVASAAEEGAREGLGHRRRASWSSDLEIFWGGWVFV
jgi:hypothetical protein